jgi:murein L,D-transpeptidase YcbB/YkuD
MAHGGRPDDSDLDDWFGGSGTAGKDRPALPLSPLSSTARKMLAAGVLALVLILIGLAAAGVFSGGSARHVSRTSLATKTSTTTTRRRKTIPVRSPTTTLKPGDHGKQVRLLQRSLAKLGYAPGSLDGQYGAATTRALTNFQRTNNLTVDGILGPATLSALTHTLKTHGG